MTGKNRRKFEAKHQKQWKCDRRSKCKAKLTSFKVHENMQVWRCSHDFRNKGMDGQKCAFDICETCMNHFIETKSEEEIIVLSSDEDDED